MSDWSCAGWAVGVGLVAFVVIFVFTMWAASGTTSAGIVRRLQRGQAQVSFRVNASRPVWDPSQPLGSQKFLYGAARASYTLDDTGMVHLHYEPKNGPAQERSGPVPEAEAARARTVLRRVLAVYVAVIMAGFGIGVAVGRGPSGERAVWGAGGVMVGMLLIWVAVMVFGVGKAVRDVSSKRRRPATW